MKKLYMLQQAYICGLADDEPENSWYEAAAVENPDDDPADGYTVRWTLTPETCEEIRKGEFDDEGDACDWEEFHVYRSGKMVGTEKDYVLNFSIAKE